MRNWAVEGLEFDADSFILHGKTGVRVELALFFRSLA